MNAQTVYEEELAQWRANRPKCVHCRGVLQGGSHCEHCGKHRGLSIEELVADWPPLSPEQLGKLATILSGGYVKPEPKVVWCTTAEASAILRCGHRRLAAIRKTGAIESRRFSNKWMYNKDDLVAFLPRLNERINNKPQSDPGLDDLIDQLIERRLQEKWGIS